MKIPRRRFIIGTASSAVLIGVAYLLGITQEIGIEPSSYTPYEQKRRFYNSKNYVLRKRLLSWGNNYDLEVEGRDVAQISQRLLNIGKYFEIKTKSGEFLGHASEIVLNLGHRSEVFDENDKKIGEVRQDLSKVVTNPGLYLDVFDGENRKSAVIDQKLLSFLTYLDVYDAEHRKIIGKIEGQFSFPQKYAISLDSDLDRRILVASAAMIDSIISEASSSGSSSGGD